MERDILLATFLSATGADGPQSVERQAKLAEQLLECLKAGRESWPGVEVPCETFAAYLGRIVRSHEGEAAEILRELHASDLYLVCACITGVPRAVESFDRTFLSRIEIYLKFVHASDLADEVRQIMREKLLVGGQNAKLSSYSGRGRLSGWVAVATQRAASSVTRSGRRGQELDCLCTDDLEQAMLSPTDFELGYLKSRYQPELREAFRIAFGNLSERDRLILRLNLVDEVSLDRIGVMYGVSQSTISRWLFAARAVVREGVERVLADSLGVGSDEVASLATLMVSDLDVSLSKLLG